MDGITEDIGRGSNGTNEVPSDAAYSLAVLSNIRSFDRVSNVIAPCEVCVITSPTISRDPPRSWLKETVGHTMHCMALHW